MSGHREPLLRGVWIALLMLVTLSVFTQIGGTSITGLVTHDSTIVIVDRFGQSIRGAPLQHISAFGIEDNRIELNFEDAVVKQIAFDGFVSASGPLGYDDQIDTNNIPLRHIRQGFAIDPSQLNFSEGQVTLTAKGTTLYKCHQWNFSEGRCEESCVIEDAEQECKQEWIPIQKLRPGQQYTISISPADPAFVETSEAVDVALAPFNNTIFLIAWVDQVQDDVSFRVMTASGLTLVGTTDVETSAAGNSRVSASAINSTHAVISWVDDSTQDVEMAIVTKAGSIVLSETDVDTNVGTNTDVSVTQLGNRYVVCYANDDDRDADFKIYNNEGTLLVGETSVDNNIAPSLILQNLIECSAINMSRWVYGWFDDQSNDATISIRSATGSSLVSAFDIDTDVGETGQVAVAGINKNAYAFAYYDSADDDITLTIRTATNGLVLSPLDIDTNAGTDSRVAIAPVRAGFNATSDNVVVAWWDQASSDIKAAVYSATGSQITAPFTVETQQDATYRLIDVAGRDPVTGNSICPGRFIIGYTNSSDQGVFKGFHINGTPWNGICLPPPDNTLPVIVTITDQPDPVNQTSLVTITANVTDNVAVDSVWVQIDGVNHSLTHDNEPAIEESLEAEENLSLSGGYVTTTNCICPSASGGSCIRDEDTWSSGQFANVTFTSALPTKNYTLTYYVCPENDGNDVWKVYVDNSIADSFTTSGGETWHARTVNITLSSGDDLTFGCSRGTDDSYCRMDYFTLEAAGGSGLWTYEHDTTGQAGLVPYTVYANDTSNNEAVPKTGNYTVVIPVFNFDNLSSAKGTGPTLNITIIIRSTGIPVSGMIADETLISAANGTIVYQGTGVSHNFSLPLGIYDITIVPVDRSRLENMTLFSVLVNSTFKLIGIDYANTSFAKGYVSLGIDPAGLAFDYAQVTRNATGTDLYKCGNWNYSASVCGTTSCTDADEDAGLCEVNSTWAPIKTGLIPGQTYSFNLTPTDPGFSEYAESGGENSTTSTTFVNKTSLTFSPDSAGKHVVIATALMHGNSQTSSVLGRLLVDGNIASEVIWEPKDGNIINDYQAYGTHVVEDFDTNNHTITLQWASESGATTFIKNASISVIATPGIVNASNEATTALGTSFSTITQAQFTPTVADDYLVMGTAEVQNDGIFCFTSAITELQIDGITVDNSSYECKDPTDFKPVFLHDVTNFSAAPHNISLRAQRTLFAGGNIRRARVSALRLTPDYDAYHQANDTPSQVSCGGTCTSTVVNKTTLSFTPAEDGDYLILATAQFNTGDDNDQTIVILEVDGQEVCEVVQEQRNNAVDDRLPFVCQRNVTLNTSIHTATIKFAAQGTSPTSTIKNARITALRLTPDDEAPQVFDVRPVANTTYDVTDTVQIAANATDNFGVDTVSATITYPNGTMVFLPLTQATGDKYNASFTIPLLIGQYNVSFTASDFVNNTNSTQTTFFVVPPVVGQPSLVVAKTDSQDPVFNGSSLNYTITISNIGTADAYNVTLTETYPVNVTFISASPVPTLPNASWSFGTLANGSAIIVDIHVQVENNLTTGSIITNLANVTYQNLTDTLSASASEDTTVIVLSNDVAGQGTSCLLTQTPRVAEPGEVVLFQADIIGTDGEPQTPISIGPVNISIVNIAGANVTTIENGSMIYLTDGIWYYEFSTLPHGDGNYMGVVRSSTFEVPSQLFSCTNVFTVLGRGVLDIEAISPDITHVNQTVQLGAQLRSNGQAVPVAQIANATLSVTKTNDTLTQVYNTTNGLVVSSGLLTVEGSFNETGVYLLNWSVDVLGRPKSAKEIVVVVDWDQKLANISASAQVIALIIENRDLLLEVLKEIEDSQEFSQEEIFLITDSVNSMSSLVKFLEDGTMSPEEAQRQLGLLQAQLAQTLGERITGRVVQSGAPWKDVFATGIVLMVLIAALLGIVSGVRRRNAAKNVREWVQKQREYGWSDGRIRETLHNHGYGDDEIDRALRRR